MNGVDAVPMHVTPDVLKPGAALRILPSGVFRTNDGRPASLPGWRLDGAIAKRVIASRPAQAGPYLIDYEHQTLNKEKNGQPAPAAGWAASLTWREGVGLMFEGIEWTAAARQKIGAKEYRYVSPVFRFDELTGEVKSVVHAAITNDPAIYGLADLSVAAASARFAATTTATPALALDDRSRLLLKELLGGVSPEAALSSAQADAAAHEAQGMSERSKEAFRSFFGLNL